MNSIVIRKVCPYKAGNEKDVYSNIRSLIDYCSDDEKIRPKVRDLDMYLDRLEYTGRKPLLCFDPESSDKLGSDSSVNRLIYGCNLSIDPQKAADTLCSYTDKIFRFKDKTVTSFMYSVIQDFDDEGMDPYTAHEIGIRMLNKVLNNRCYVYLCTHTNTDRIHNHILIFRFSLDGMWLREPVTRDFSLEKMCAVTNRLIEEYGFEAREFIKTPSVGNNMIFKERDKLVFRYPSSISGYLIRDMDYCIKLSYDINDFFDNMMDLGYEIFETGYRSIVFLLKDNWRTYYPVYYYEPSDNRNRGLGEGYSISSIMDRIKSDKEKHYDKTDMLVVPLQNGYKYLYSPLNQYAYMFYDKVRFGIPGDIKEFNFKLFFYAFSSMLSVDLDDLSNKRYIPPSMRKYVSEAKISAYRKIYEQMKNGFITVFKDIPDFISDNKSAKKQAGLKLREINRLIRICDDPLEYEKLGDLKKEIQKEKTGYSRLENAYTLFYNEYDRVFNDMISAMEIYQRLDETLTERLIEKEIYNLSRPKPLHRHIKKRIDHDRELVQNEMSDKSLKNEREEDELRIA